MRKKIFSALMLGLIMAGTASTVTSCKDYDEDLAALQAGQADLKASVDAAVKSLESQIATVDAAIKSVDAKVAAGDEATLVAAKAAIESAVAELKAAHDKDVAELSAAILKAQAAADAANNLLDTKADKTALEDAQKTLQNQITVLSDGLADAVKDIATLDAALKAQAAALENAKKDLEAADKANLEAALKAVNDLKAAVDKQVKDLDAKIAAEIKKVNDELATKASAADLNELKKAHNALAEDVKGNTQQISGLKDRLNEVVSEFKGEIAKLNVITAALSKSLRSLVFYPELYVDGIEAYEYKYLSYEPIKISSPYGVDRDKAIRGTTYDQKLSGLTDYKILQPTVLYGPAWPVSYHMNPSSANVAFSDVKGFINHSAEVITRAPGQSADVKLTATEKYVDNTAFPTYAGYLTVGMQIGDVKKWIEKYNDIASKGAGATGNKSYGKDEIFALQVNSHLDNVEKKDTLITSDYALVYPTKTTIEGLVWTKELTGKNDDDVTCGKKPGSNDEKGTCTQLVHVWDTPEEALLDDTKNIVQLYYNDQKGYNLEDYLGVHYKNTSDLKSNMTTVGTWNFTGKEMGQYGLTYKFELINYTIDANKTSDSQFLVDGDDFQKKGNIVAKNVKEDGKTPADQALAAVDREPLVRVTVSRGSDVVLDGYILIHITEKPVVVTPEKPTDLAIESFPEYKETFDLCNAGQQHQTTWAQFNWYVLTNEKWNDKAIEKEVFDKHYAADVITGTKTTLTGGGYKYQANHYTTKECTTANPYGQVYYYENEAGTTNHTFSVELSAEDMEAILHHNTSATYTTWVRYKQKTTEAKYKNVVIKLTIKITRKTIETATIGEKNKNYWFAQDGKDNGFDVIALNVFEPIDNGTVGTQWNRSILSTFVGNTVKLTGVIGTSAQKFFFTPYTSTLTTLKGNTYTITPQSSASDVLYKRFVCLYNLDGTTTHEYKVGDEDANQKVLNTCAIDYNKGVYTNDALYAVKGGTYTKIATLNQLTGQIDLIYSDLTKELVNAIGYEQNHSNLMKELHAQVAVVAQKNCYAIDMKGDEFFTSWQRPINIVKGMSDEAVDAKTNGNRIPLAKHLNFFDWRGPKSGSILFGDMNEASTKWLWAYYGINKITVNCDPAVVQTNMHQANASTFVALNMITTKAALYADKAGNMTHTYNFDLSTYDSQAKSQDLFDLFEKDAESYYNLNDMFGAIYYQNNGDNVEEFIVKVPVTVEYLWGSFTEVVTIKIKRTLGN